MIQNAPCNDTRESVTLNVTMVKANDTSEKEAMWRAYGEWIETHRRRNTPFSQEAAALRAGMERQQWSRIIKGTSGTKRATVIRMAKAVNVDVNEALTRAGFAAPISEEEKAEFDESYFARLYFKHRKLSEISKQRAKEFERIYQMVERDYDRELLDKGETIDDPNSSQADPDGME